VKYEPLGLHEFIVESREPGALRRPFSEVPLIASGGVNQTNVIDYIRAGVKAVGIGRDLIHQNAIKQRERGWISELARRCTNMVKEARELQKPEHV
jgi:2-dehydro-3-deoxyphosphogluconate aldolase / (4S)-4-hydroxy-2-oxoglutarate aldolase